MTRISLHRSTVIYTILAILMTFCSLSLNAQQIRTAYFMDDSPLANMLNPSTIPERGFIGFPGIHATGGSYLSNGMALGNFIFRRNGENVSFMDDRVSGDAFLKNIKNYNTFTVDASANILGAGWHTRKGFITIGIGAKTNINGGIPKKMFQFMKEGVEISDNYSIKNFRLLGESYSEIYGGYSRRINSKILVGAKMKVLLGFANIDMKVSELSAKYNGESNVWKTRTSGQFNASMKGFSVNDNDGYIRNFHFGTPGICGAGAAIDLGVTYNPMRNFRISASVLDLGFLKWSKSSTISGKTDKNMEVDFSGFENIKEESVGKQLEDILNDLEDLFQFEEISPKSRTTMLRATLNVGAEYSILNNLLGFGVLSSTRFYQPKAYTELTAMMNVRPNRWFNCALSYSFIHSQFKSFGFAMNFNTRVVNFFVGSDYLVFNMKNGIPQTGESINAYIGLSIALGRSKYGGIICSDRQVVM